MKLENNLNLKLGDRTMLKTWNSKNRRNIKYEIISDLRSKSLIVFDKNGISEFIFFKANKINEYYYISENGKKYTGNILFMIKWILSLYF